MAAGPSRGSLGSLSVAVGANTEGLTQVVGELRKVATAVRSLSTRVSNQTAKMEAAFGKAAKSTRKVTTETNKATKASKMREASLLKETRAIQAAESRTLNLVSAMRRAGASSSEIRNLTAATRKFRNEIKGAQGNSTAFANAQLRLAKTTNTARRRLTNFNSAIRKRDLKVAAERTENFRNKMQDLSKSVSLALGPLSGVASRITAFSGLANRNTIAIAGMIGAVIGLGFVIKKAVQAGSEFEIQFRRIEAQLELTGRAAEFSAVEVNKIAEEVADATLTNAKTARQAASALLFFTRVAKKDFKTVLNLAQGLSAVLGGDLTQSAKRIGRALQDPGEGLKSLNRQLALLTPRQEQVAVGLSNMGKEAEAADFIIRRLREKLQGLAVLEAAGVAGAFDTLLERVGRFLEIAGEAGGILQPFTESFARISERLQQVNSELRKMPDGLKLVGKGLSAIAFAIEAIAFNLDTILVVVGAALIGKLIRGFFAVAASIRGATIAMIAFKVAAGLVNIPMALFLGTTIALAAQMKLFNKEIDKTTLKGLEKGIEGTTKKIEDLQSKLDGIRRARSLGGREERLLGRGGLSADEAELEKLKELLTQLTRQQTKLTIEQGKSGLGVENFDAFGDSAADLDAELGDVTKRLLEINNSIALLSPTASKADKDIVKIAGRLGLMRVTAEDGSVSLISLKKSLDEVTKGFIRALPEIEDALARETRGLELAAERTELFSTSLSRLEKPQGLEGFGLELDNLAVAFASGLISFERFIQLSDALADSAQKFRDDVNFRTFAEEAALYADRQAEANMVMDETSDRFGTLNVAMREFNKELSKLQTLRNENFIGDETFERKLENLEVQLAKNIEGVQTFADTVSSGFAQGILAGDKFSDMLGRIGDRLAEVALQALITRAILATIGGFAAGETQSQTTAGAATQSDVSAAPNDFLVTGTPTGTTTPRTVSSGGGGSTTTIIHIDARASDPGVEARVTRAINRADRTNRVLIQNNQTETSRRV